MSPSPVLLAVLAQAPTATPTPPLIEQQELPPGVQSACGTLEPGPFCTWVYDATNNELLAGLAGRIIPGLLEVALILAVAYVATLLAHKFIKRAVRRVAQDSVRRLGILRSRGPLADTDPVDLTRATLRTETVAGVLRSIAVAGIWSIAVVMALGVFGVNLGPLIAGAGIVGIALGFGAQNLVKDFLSGLFMLLEDQYGVGDVVDVGEAAGVVEGISLRTTRLRDVEGTVWHVPNGEIRRVGNKSQQWARSLVDVGVAYDTDIDFAKDVIKRVADSLWHDEVLGHLVLEEPEVWGVEAFGADQITIRLVMKVEPATQWKVNRALRQRIKEVFDAEGIEIPFPQRTVWMRTDDGHAQTAHKRPAGEDSVGRAPAGGSSAPGGASRTDGDDDSASWLPPLQS